MLLGSIKHSMQLAVHTPHFCTAIDASIFASTAPTFIMARSGNGRCSEWPMCLKKYAQSPSAETRLHSTDPSTLVCSIMVQSMPAFARTFFVVYQPSTLWLDPSVLAKVNYVLTFAIQA